MPDTTQNTTNLLANVDWEDLLDTLEAEKCLLFLGSGAFEAPGGSRIETALRDWLEADVPDNPYIRLYNPDGFMLFRKNRFKRKITAQIKDFYNQAFPETEALFRQLAEAPFSMIVTLTTPHLCLNQQSVLSRS